MLFGIFLALAVFVYGYIQYNLARYSVYYASHMPRKEGAKPELVMALENINWIDKQNTENVRFDEEETGSVYINRNAYFTYAVKGYYIGINKMNGSYYYDTDQTGKLTTYSFPDDNWEEKSLDEEKLQEIEAILDPVIKDIIESQKTPTINLQKLFNQKYESRFNH